MPSKIQVDQIAGATGSTVTLPSGQTLDLSSGTVTLPNSSVNLTTKVTGTLPVANGGTGLTTLGSATQVLRVNSGATALEFASASSDFVKLESTTVSSAVTSVSLDGYFTSDYDTYIYQFYDFDFDTTTFFGARFRSANTQLTATNYRTGRANDPYYDNSGSSDTTGATTWVADYIQFSRDDAGTSTGNGVTQGELILHKPLDTSNYKMANGYFHYYRFDAATIQRVQFGGLYDATASALSGITFLATSGNIIRGTIKLYGIKN